MDNNISKFRIIENLKIYERPNLEDLKLVKNQSKNIHPNQSNEFTTFSDLLKSSLNSDGMLKTYKRLKIKSTDRISSEETKSFKFSNVVEAIEKDFENLDDPMVVYSSPPRKILKSLENIRTQEITLKSESTANTVPPAPDPYCFSSSSSSDDESDNSTFTTGKFSLQLYFITL
jgi:hypothetical protein